MSYQYNEVDGLRSCPDCQERGECGCPVCVICDMSVCTPQDMAIYVGDFGYAHCDHGSGSVHEGHEGHECVGCTHAPKGTVTMRRIKVEAWIDRMGNTYIRPVSERWQRRFARIVAANGGGDNCTAFFQEHVPEAIPERYRFDIIDGYTVRWLVDPREVGLWYGYDAHTAAE